MSLFLCISLESSINVFKVHEAHVHGLAWIGANMCVSGCEKGWLICHDIRSPQYAWRASVLSTSHSGICSAAASSSGSDIVLGMNKGGLCVFSVNQQRFVIPQIQLHEDDIRHVLAWDSSVSKGVSSSLNVLTTSFDGTGAIWKLDNSKGEPSLIKSDSLLNGHEDKMLCAVRCPNTGQIVTTGADGRTVLWS